MNARHASCALIVAIGLLGLPSVSLGVEGDSRTSSVRLTHEMAREVVSAGDLNAMAAAIGIDYPVLLERALSRKPAAIFLLLWMAGNAPLDGAGAEGYTYTMVRAAKVIGDEALSEASQKLDASSQQAVIEAFLFEYGGADDPKQAAADASKDFPKFWATTERQQGEQGGAGQPATRSESDPEGGDKPQPESEGRSR